MLLVLELTVLSSVSAPSGLRVTNFIIILAVAVISCMLMQTRYAIDVTILLKCTY